MSARGRVLAVVAAAALLAGIGVAAVAVAGEDVGGAEALRPLPEARPDAPPICNDLGVRTDPEAVDLRRALALYGRKGRGRRARSLFLRHESLEARVGDLVTRVAAGRSSG